MATTQGAGGQQEQQLQSGIKEELADDTIRPGGVSAWGGWPQAGTPWTQIVISEMSGTPQDVSKLVLNISPKAGNSIGLPLKSKDLKSPVLALQSLEGASVWISKQSLFSSKDATVHTQLTSAGLTAGQELHLKYTDSFKSDLGGAGQSLSEAIILLGYQPYWPDANSDTDRDPQNATLIPFESLAENSVSFDDAKATRHMSIAQCDELGGDGLFWIQSKGNVGLTSSMPFLGQSGLLRILAGQGSPKFALYKFRFGPNSSLIRVQCEAPASEAEYGLQVTLAGPHEKPQLLRILVKKWITCCCNSLRGSFEFKAATDAEWTDLNLGIHAIRRETSRSPEILALALDETIEPGTHEFFEGLRQGYWDVLENVVKLNMDDFRTIEEHPGFSAPRVQCLVNLLLAEKNLPYNKAALIWANTQTDLPSALNVRLSKFIAQSARA